MRYLGALILLSTSVIFAQDAAKFYFIAVDGSYMLAVDGVRTKVEGKHYIQQTVAPGRHSIGYQIGYFGDWTATSFKAVAGQDYFFVFGSEAGRGRWCYQLSSTQGKSCLQALENRGRPQPCSVTEGNVNPLLKSNAPLTSSPSRNLVPGGFHTRTPR